MTRSEAETIIRELHAAFAVSAMSSDRLKVYADAIERLPRDQTYRAIREVMRSKERMPSVGLLMHLIDASEAVAAGKRPSSYTNRAGLVLSDVCEQCGRRITDEEFESDNWTFTVNAADEAVGRVHHRCYGKPKDAQPPNGAAADDGIPF
jgi:hypothetical protein